jgi:hypothetical protein
MAAGARRLAPNDALAGATPYLRLFGSTLGGCMLAGEALAAKSNGDAAAIRSATSRWRGSLPKHFGAGTSLEKTVIDSADAVNGADAVLLLIHLKLGRKALGLDAVDGAKHEAGLDPLLDRFAHQRRRAVILVQGFKPRGEINRRTQHGVVHPVSEPILPTTTSPTCRPNRVL